MIENILRSHYAYTQAVSTGKEKKSNKVNALTKIQWDVSQWAKLAKKQFEEVRFCFC